MFVIDCVTVNVDAADIPRISSDRPWLFATNAATVRARDDRVTGLPLLRLHLNSHLDKEGREKKGSKEEEEVQPIKTHGYSTSTHHNRVV